MTRGPLTSKGVDEYVHARIRLIDVPQAITILCGKMRVVPISPCLVGYLEVITVKKCN